ncbi:unnamed protein product, partial [Cyprideis torosa]
MAVHGPSPMGRDARIEIFNGDGSQAGACGNGTRCVVQWLHGQTGSDQFSFEVQGNPIKAQFLEDGRISVNMGVPRFEWDQIPLSEEFADTRGIELEVGPLGAPILHTPSVVNTGNPHVVFWATKDVNTYALDKFGPMLEQKRQPPLLQKRRQPRKPLLNKRPLSAPLNDYKGALRSALFL